jgi:hypothetical protein
VGWRRGERAELSDKSVDTCNAQHLLNSMRAPCREFGTLTHCGTGEKRESCEVACTLQMPGAAACCKGAGAIVGGDARHLVCAHMCINRGGDQLTVQLLSNCASLILTDHTSCSPIVTHTEVDYPRMLSGKCFAHPCFTVASHVGPLLLHCQQLQLLL